MRETYGRFSIVSSVTSPAILRLLLLLGVVRLLITLIPSVLLLPSVPYCRRRIRGLTSSWILRVIRLGLRVVLLLLLLLLLCMLFLLLLL